MLGRLRDQKFTSRVFLANQNVSTLLTVVPRRHLCHQIPTFSYNTSPTSKPAKRKRPVERRKQASKELKNEADMKVKKTGSEGECSQEHDLVLYFDGGARGNGTTTAVAGCGAVLYKEGLPVWKGRECLPIGFTNNQAEYMGLIHGLKKALTLASPDSIAICAYGDSSLVVNQVMGQWQVGALHLRPLVKEARELLSQFHSHKLAHVLRKDNVVADQLANEAMDSRSSSWEQCEQV